MMHAFRESVDPATVRAKSLEARLAQESQRCLQMEKQMQDLRGNAAQAVTRINDLEARLAGAAERMLHLEKQMQAFLGSTKHPIAQVRDLEPRIVEPEQLSAEAIQKVVVKAPRQARRKV
jgi:predicted  nucleic acid-binding Zn-ribbon protein